jgi:putative inorganic carbon (hco3(-)) transporter
MSVTAIVWLLLYCAAAVATFSNPVFGSLGYLLEYYMRPELKWWGDQLPDLRWNLIISLALGLSFVLRRTSLRQMVAVPNPVLRWLLGLAAVMVLVSPTVAVDSSLSWEWSTQWVKMAIIFPLLVVGVLRTPSGFDWFISANMLGAGWWGYQAWMDPKREASRLINIGSGDSLDDNSAASHLLTILPMILVLALTEKNKRIRALALVATPLVMNTIILCNSRGATVAMVVALAAALVLVRSGYRLRLVIGGTVMGAIFLSLADPQFISRQQTTTNYEEDSSSQQRLETWRGAFRLVADRPFGAGGRGFHLLSPVYIPEIVEIHDGQPRAPHNTWAQVAAEWGVLGLICFTGMWVSAFRVLRLVKKKATADEQPFYYWRAFAIQLGIIGHLVSGVFGDRLYGEAGYWLLALSFALYRIQLTEAAQPDLATVQSPSAVAA